MIKIAIDCFGGDLSPMANVEGSVNALKNNQDIELILTGDQDKIQAELNKYDYDKNRITILDAKEVVSCNQKPTDAIKNPNTSLYKAIDIVKHDDTVAGLVSCGSTGAVLCGAVLKIGRLKNVIRPAFCPIMPTMNGKIVGICDSGANAECKPEYLQQFGIMGARYLEAVYGVDNPKVALLNIGTEEEKGDTMHIEAHKLLKSTPTINFVGNMESRDVLSGKYDLVVCDGFSGNVLLKATEGACLEVLKMLKHDLMSSLKNKIGALFIKKTLYARKAFMDYRNYGGGIMLGTKKIVVKCHGNGNATSIEKCINQVYMMEHSKINEKIESELAITNEKGE